MPLHKVVQIVYCIVRWLQQGIACSVSWNATRQLGKEVFAGRNEHYECDA